VRYPSPNNATWKSYRYGSDVITIDTDSDANACSPCTYFIAIVGLAESTYSLVASVESTTFQVHDGSPMTGTVGMLSWNYYTFYNYHGSARDFRVLLTSSVGNADLYVTLGQYRIYIYRHYVDH
jgi:hypothetical protein